MLAPNCRALPLCCPEKLVLVVRAVFRPDVCPQPTAGDTVRLACTLSSLFQGQDLLWGGVAPVWATCTLPGLGCASMRYGILAGVDPQGAQGRDRPDGQA